MMTDRELDAQVAKVIFGLDVVAMDWPCHEDPETGDWYACFRATDLGERHEPVYAEKPEDFEPSTSGFVMVQVVHWYSSEIDWAWHVVEKMNSYPDTEYETWVKFRDGLCAEAFWCFPADEAARIICMAALRAKGIEVE